MATVYVRNVPDDVVDRLEVLAGRAGMSVSAYCARALGEVSRAAANPQILDSLPDLRVAAGVVVDAVASGRSDRAGTGAPVGPSGTRTGTRSRRAR